MALSEPSLDRSDRKRLASAAMAAEKPADAIPHLLAMLAETPEAGWLWLFLAKTAAAAGDLGRASDAAVAYVELGASVEDARTLARTLGDHPGPTTLRALATIADLDPVCRPFHARALQATDPTEALPIWRRLLDEQPYHLEANEHLQLAAHAARPGPRIALVGNCQTYGIADCLRLMWSDCRPEAIFNREAPERGYDIVLRQGVDFPAVHFTGLHPDLAHQPIKGRFFRWHSRIVLDAWAAGESEKQATERFCLGDYLKRGYLDAFALSADKHRRLYERCGMTFRPPEGRFVYVPNHPDIRVLHDIAEALCRRLGHEPEAQDQPPDLQALRLIWPIYPEIAEALGRPGDLRFVTSTGPEIGLAEMVSESFERYGGHHLPRA